MFKKKKSDSSNIENQTIPENGIFSKEDFDNLKNSKKWYLSTKIMIILVIALPFSVFAGPFVFLGLLLAESIFLILIAIQYNKSFDFIQNKMFEGNKIYTEKIPKAENELEELKTLIQNKENIVRETSTKVNEVKTELEKYEKDYSEKVKFVEEYNSKKANYDNLLQETKDLEERLKDVLYQKEHLAETEAKIVETTKQLEAAKAELIEMNDEVLIQSFGLYEPKYDFENSEQYMERLREIRDKQRYLIKDRTGVTYADNWTVDGSLEKGRAMTNKNIQSAFKLFNAECDIAINKVTYKNIESTEKRIRKSFEQVNKLYEPVLVKLKENYLSAKIDELYLYFEYLQKKQEEKEEQAALREQMREEAKVQREIEREKKKIEKEKIHFNTELDRLKDNIPDDTNEKSIWEAKIAELEAKIAELQEVEEDVLHKEKNTRAGYVYIISNIGSFGENIYKIGLTRRLDPMERVNELGDASVPFKFDVHATIFSEDAPALENALHKAFESRRVNKVNSRKEFFHVTLDEIKQEVEKNFNKTVEYTKYAEAMEYRQSLKIREEMQ